MKPYCLVITSIHGSDNLTLQKHAAECQKNGAHFIVAGDRKSPASFDLPGCDFLSLEQQQSLPFILARLLPDNNYAKKNLGYLQAIEQGFEIIVESDDDNQPLENFREARELYVRGDLASQDGWVNVYRYFSDALIWPRGFSLNHIKAAVSPIVSTDAVFFSPVQQALVNENPDVDAIYRLTMELPFYFKNRKPVILGQNSVCPFNSQNTTWFKPAFPLLYLPSYCSFRMCDIWRSLIAQRIFQANNWYLSFHPANVCQKRNDHDLMKDLEQELPGYQHNASIMDDLMQLELQAGEEHIYDNLRACYQLLTDKEHIGKQELSLLDAWIRDLQSLR